MKHSLPTEIINEVLGYLSSKAFSEVSALIAKIQANAVQLPEEVLPPLPVEEKPE